MFTFKVEAEAVSFDYLGKDSETKEILLEPTGNHMFEGEIQVKVIREADMYLDFEADEGFEETELISGKLRETEYVPIFESDVEEYLEGAYTVCPDCGRKINWENDGGNGFCIACAPDH